MPPSAKTVAFLKLARDRWDQAQEAEKNQREREQEDLKFYAGDQWPEDIRTSRAGQVAANGLPAVPARPCLTINKTREPVRQVLNQERQSDMGIEIVPADDFGELVGPIDETEIELREGLVRRIQRESKAADARTWAFNRSTIAGRGYYGVMTRYVPGKTNDQEIYIHRWYNQSCVTLDPAHEQPDGSDAEWAFVGTDIPWARYKAEYPKRNGQKNAVCDYSDDEFRAVGEDRPGWYRTEGETRICRVVNYYYTERTPRTLCTLAGGSAEWKDKLPAGAVVTDTRDVIEKTIQWATLDGCDDDVLEETDWPGPDMPIVKVLGEELQPYDEERRCEGMVRPMREPGRGYNYMVSRWVELIGLSPLVPLMVAEGQIEGYEAWYEAANTRTLPYLPYKQSDLDGRPAGAPSAPPNREPPIAAVASSVQMFDEAIQSTSGQHDPSLGKVDPSVKSGRAIEALREQSQRSSNHFLDNLQRSMRYEGQIINNLLYPIYGRPGRIARILNGEGQAETVLLHTPMIQQDGKPVAAPENHPQAKTYTLTKDAQFNVIVKVSKNYDSRRTQEAAIIGELLTKNPELMAWFGDLFFKNQDGPGHQQMADRAKVMLDPKILAMLSAKEQGQTMPPEVQAKLSAADQQIQQLSADLQEAQAPAAVETVKQQGAQAIKAMELQFQREKMEADNETKLAVAELGAKVDRLALFMEERARLGVESHEVGMSALAHGQATEARESEQGHAAAMAAAGAQSTAEQADADRAHQADMAAQAAAAEPQEGAGA